MASFLLLPFLLQFLQTSSSKTCILNGNGGCDLSCSGVDACKDGQLYCRSGYDCTINCNGDNSCAGNTQTYANGAIDVDITCDGYHACDGIIYI